MVAISFSGTTSRGPFYELIRRGEKRQTCRKPRKRPFRVGDWLTLYWKVRVPRSRKPVHLIGGAEISDVRRITLAEVWDDEAFARADGFGSLEEFRDWFLPEWREWYIKYPDPLHPDATPAQDRLKLQEYDVIKWSKICWDDILRIW